MMPYPTAKPFDRPAPVLPLPPQRRGHALRQAAGLMVERGVRVHDTMQTLTDPRIYAVGECVNHRGVTYGLVAPLFEQTKVCANHLAEWGIARYGGSAVATRLKVTGIDLFSAGRFLPGAGDETLLFEDAGRGVYKKLVVRDNRLVGACLPELKRLIREMP